MAGLANFEDFHLGFENGEIQFYDFEIVEQTRGTFVELQLIASAQETGLAWNLHSCHGSGENKHFKEETSASVKKQFSRNPNGFVGNVHHCISRTVCR
jgi:hypothetical protein